MSKRKNPETSLEAYRSLDPDKMQQICKDIISALSVIGEGTFEEIAAFLKIDKSRVWKRLSEMEKNDLIYRPGNKRILKSGRSGFTWMLRTDATPKTEKQEKYIKGQNTASDYAKNIISITQPSLF